ncbi:ANTAR domain-containing protein [Streptomyces sp. NPDC049099]|uniref:ANTAR domain-containing protein n=1 Tax=Streptomyces sp. NPDC049099 TaxID=3155768 RepID=UPI00342EF315
MTQPRPASLRFAAGDRERGVGSMSGVLLCTDREDFGALNLCSHLHQGVRNRRPASHAAVALASTHTINQLQHAIDSRHTIGEAVGIPTERHHLGEGDALDVLRRISQHRNTKLRDVVQQVPPCSRPSSPA